MASVIDKHPQRDKIIEAILAGASLRTVAKRYDVSVMVVHRYKRNVVAKAVKTASKMVHAQQVTKTPQELIAATADETKALIAADPVLQRLEEQRRKRESWAAGAEGKGDYRALTGFDRNELSEIELLAKLTGRLDTAAASTNNNIVIIPVTVTGVSPAVPPCTGSVIDVEPTE